MAENLNDSEVRLKRAEVLKNLANGEFKCTFT